MKLLRIKHACLIVCVAWLTSARTAHPTTVVELTFNELVAQADVIAVGTVSDIREQWDATHNVPLTLVTFSDLTVLKGNPGVTMTLEFLGGTRPNGLVMVIAGVPRFRVGERAGVFDSGNGTTSVPSWAYGKECFALSKTRKAALKPSVIISGCRS